MLYVDLITDSRSQAELGEICLELINKKMLSKTYTAMVLRKSKELKQKAIEYSETE